MVSRGDVRLVTSNSQYGQWFDASRRSTLSSVGRHVDALPRQHDQSTSAKAHTSQHSHMLPWQQLASRDQPLTSSSLSCDDSTSSPRIDSREVSWRSITIPLPLQRSTTTLGPAGRPATSGYGVDGLSGQSHADLIRDYKRYRQLQANITGEQNVWRNTNRLLARPTVVDGQPVNTSASSNNVQSTVSGSTSDHQLHRRTDTESTTVVPLQLDVAGPTPLQRSVATVVSERRLPADFTVGRAHNVLSPGSPLSSTFVNVDNTSDTRKLNSISQVFDL